MASKLSTTPGQSAMKSDKRANYPEGNPDQPKNLAAKAKGSTKVTKAAPNTFQYDQDDSELNKRGMSSPLAAKWFKECGLKLPKNAEDGHLKK